MSNLEEKHLKNDRVGRKNDRLRHQWREETVGVVF